LRFRPCKSQVFHEANLAVAARDRCADGIQEFLPIRVGSADLHRDKRSRGRGAGVGRLFPLSEKHGELRRERAELQHSREIGSKHETAAVAGRFDEHQFGKLRLETRKRQPRIRVSAVAVPPKSGFCARQQHFATRTEMLAALDRTDVVGDN
jgi:hypothetical protein